MNWHVCLQGSARHLTECVDLLLQLGEPASGLCDDFLSHARTKLEDDLATLTRLAEAAAEAEQEGGPHQEAGEAGAEEPAKEVPQEEQSGSGGGNGVPVKAPPMVSRKCAPLTVLNLICYNPIIIVCLGYQKLKRKPFLIGVLYFALL